MGPPRSSKKRPQANSAHRRVKEISQQERGMSQRGVERIRFSAPLEREKTRSVEDSGGYSK
jgi:hypothetical protein